MFHKGILQARRPNMWTQANMQIYDYFCLGTRDLQRYLVLIRLFIEYEWFIRYATSIVASKTWADRLYASVSEYP